MILHSVQRDALNYMENVKNILQNTEDDKHNEEQNVVKIAA